MSRLKPVKTARALRRKQTEAERALWTQLRKMRASGPRFRRQHPLGHYIVDFVCLEKKLILEIDGGHHNEDAVALHDADRTKWLENEGFRVLRFWNNEVISNLDGVFAVIDQALR